MSVKLTDLYVEKLKPDSAKRMEIPDATVPGLFLVVQPTGAKSWAVRYRSAGASKKLTIAKYPAMSLKIARDRARQAIGKVADGKDPAAEKQALKEAAKKAKLQDGQTVEKVVADFVEKYAKRKNRSWEETERILKREIVDVWKDRLLSEVGRADLHNLLDQIVDRGSPITANRTLAAFRRLCNWAIERGIIDQSPCEKVKAPAAEQSRNRILSDDELRMTWLACDEIGWPFGPLVQLLILTGQRRDEVSSVSWHELDLDQRKWVIPRERCKNDSEHLVPLSNLAVAILKPLPRIKSKASLVFTSAGDTSVSGFSRAKDRIDALMLKSMQKNSAEPDKVQLQPWTLHDLRRTAASGMARSGAPVHVVEAVLNHRSGSIKGVAAVYNRYSYEAEKREALDAWADHVLKVVGQEPVKD